MEICLVFLIFLKTGWENVKLFSSQWSRGLVSASHASGRRIGPHPSHFFTFYFFFNLVMLFCFSNHPFIGIDSDTFFFILELFKEAWECGYKKK